MRCEMIKAEELPLPCPICGASVYLVAVTEWGADDGYIVTIEYDCETEPDIDGNEWEDWFKGHFHMPYVDWLPWENKILQWLNRRYYCDGGALRLRTAADRVRAER